MAADATCSMGALRMSREPRCLPPVLAPAPILPSHPLPPPVFAPAPFLHTRPSPLLHNPLAPSLPARPQTTDVAKQVRLLPATSDAQDKLRLVVRLCLVHALGSAWMLAVADLFVRAKLNIVGA